MNANNETSELPDRFPIEGAISRLRAGDPGPPGHGEPAVLPGGRPWLDVALIVLAFPALLLVGAVVGAWIKVASRGGVFYRQTRVGFRGQRFAINKFRTMAVDAATAEHESHVAELLRSDRPMTKLDSMGDTRLIRGGALLRASGLDELPQVLNVLRGEMRLVGPRPCLPREYEFYTPEQRERFEVWPGITGYWQVKGKNSTTFSEMVALDIHYVRNRSALMDLRLLLETPGAILAQWFRSRKAREVVRDEPCGEDPVKSLPPGRETV